MKYLDEYRDGRVAAKIVAEIRRVTTRPWTLMEVCGGQTHSIVKHGIDRLRDAGPELRRLHDVLQAVRRAGGGDHGWQMVPALRSRQGLPNLRDAAATLSPVLLRMDGIADAWPGMEARALEDHPAISRGR